MIVAYWFPTNESIICGVLDEPGQTTGTALTDGFEVDAEITSFPSRAAAELWLAVHLTAAGLETPAKFGVVETFELA